MIKFLIIFLIFFFVSNCSLNQSEFWTKEKKIEKEKKFTIKKFTKEKKVLEKELNPNLKITLSAKLIKNSFINNLDNNNGRINYNGNLKSISRYKFSKIDDFYQFEPEIVFDNNNVIFFNNNGSILKFDESSRLIWKKNYV